jgi:hypothetical protein
LLSAAIALLKCCSGRIGMAPTACSRRLAESGMRVQVPPPSTPDRGHEEKPLFYESKRWLDTGPEPFMGRRRVSDRSQGSHAPGSARVAVVVLPPLGGTTLVPIPRAGARAQGLLQGLGVRETLVRGLGQTS